MPHINILKEMFKNSEIIPLEEHPYRNGKKQVTLSEKDISVPLLIIPEALTSPQENA